MPRHRLPDTLRDPIERSADPARAAVVLEAWQDQHAAGFARAAEDAELAARLVAVVAASPYLARVCTTEPAAVDVLAAIDRPVPGPPPTEADGDGLVTWKRLETLRVATRDLLGADDVADVGRRLADLADGLLEAALGIGGAPADLAVVGMGKLGARELNYASDVDVLLVGTGDVRPFLNVARRAWRIDLDLRPEGRAGPIVRSLASYEAYWDRWAEVWEFQALLKARRSAGSRELGDAFCAAAAERVWNRPFGADELRSVRALKARAEGEVARAGLSTRELKRGQGGIRDIEFCLQLLQLVHGRADPTLRAPATLEALRALAAGGYVSTGDAEALASAYCFLRTVEHRLQLWEDQPVYAVPADVAARTRLARVLGYRDTPAARAVELFDGELQHHQAVARAIHERLFFRPLLEAFTAPVSWEREESPNAASAMPAEAIVQRLAAFGFSDADRTRQAVRTLTRGLTRSSALMAQLLPRLLDWLSHAPDPDLGLLGLRSLTDEHHRRDQLMITCRESPEAARRLCVLLGTGSLFTRGFEADPDALVALTDGRWLAPADHEQLAKNVRQATVWRRRPVDRQAALLRWKNRQILRIAGRDVLGESDADGVGEELTAVAETVLSAALEAADPQVPMAVIGMGRLGGAELGYASDLDVLLVYEAGKDDTAAPTGAAAEAARAAEAAATSLLRAVNGETPAARLYTLDVGLRPEGRHGPLARSVGAYAAYYDRWAQVWERQALLRGRFVAGDPRVGERFAAVAEDFVWGRPLDAASVREIRRMKARVERERIPAGEDPQFHLKLGRGSLSDVEWTVQLLQLRSGVRATGTLPALAALTSAGAVEPEDAAVLADAYRFCESTRNRLYLVRAIPGDALPAAGHALTTLARSLETTPSQLRDAYRRRTRRARRVVERLFYGRPA